MEHFRSLYLGYLRRRSVTRTEPAGIVEPPEGCIGRVLHPPSLVFVPFIWNFQIKYVCLISDLILMAPAHVIYPMGADGIVEGGIYFQQTEPRRRVARRPQGHSGWAGMPSPPLLIIVTSVFVCQPTSAIHTPSCQRHGRVNRTHSSDRHRSTTSPRAHSPRPMPPSQPERISLSGPAGVFSEGNHA